MFEVDEKGGFLVGGEIREGNTKEMTQELRSSKQQISNLFFRIKR